MKVVDSSVLVELLLLRPGAARLEALLFEDNEAIHAPHLIDIEIAHVFRRLARLGDLIPARAEKALAQLASMRLQRYPHTPLLTSIWGWRDNLTAYDASYVALALNLDAVLFTRDQRLATAAGHRVEVVVV